MAEVSDREYRLIAFTDKLGAAQFAKVPFTIAAQDLAQIRWDIVDTAKERNQLEDEVLALSSLVLGEHRDAGERRESKDHP